jgi:transcriptional regulator of acetoin/glycerol metabolism
VSHNSTLKFSKKAEEALRSYHWPGNIREMINVFELCMALSDGAMVDLGELPDQFQK